MVREQSHLASARLGIRELPIIMHYFSLVADDA